MNVHSRNTAARQATTSVAALHDHGQAPWLDFLARKFVADGSLRRLVERDGVTGVTSNPSIFEKAIGESDDYDEALNNALAKSDRDVMSLYETLAIEDIRNAADVLLPVYKATNGADGFVSLEVSPYLARDTKGTLAEARRLWKTVGRENVMIKIPGTPEGIPAFQQAISEGINVNVTLLFAQDVYAKVAEAYIAGLEQFAAGGGDVSKIASVASFFISRIDTLADSIIEARIKASKDPKEQQQLKALEGKIAIANGKETYEKYQAIFASNRWKALAAKGGQTQRVLWASTSTKNPAYRDVIYVEELIGPDTVNTIPPATLDAFRDHGIPRASLTENIDAAHRTMEAVAKVGISMKEITDKLTDDGVRLFAEAFDKLLEAVEKSSKSK